LIERALTEQPFQASLCGLAMTHRPRSLPARDDEPLYNPTSTLLAVLAASRKTFRRSTGPLERALNR
jgi:hypothetical protein